MIKRKIIIVFTILIINFVFPITSLANKDEEMCLEKSYALYKKEFITSDGRVMDPERGDITVSEGQAYMLLRAVVMNDKKTFDKVYNWTKTNLQRKDKLFSWIWGKDKDGNYKIIDKNSASDADVNIAFALCVAGERWNNKKHLEEAKPIINSIWKNETRHIGKHIILMPGAAQAKSIKIEVNPSYFAPYAFRSFKKVDKWHNWEKIIDSSYYYIMASSAKTKTGLPPNWFLIEKGEIVLENSERSDFSYDAVRVFKKAHLDYIESGDKRNLKILEKSKFFITQWKKSKNFYTNYRADGSLRDLNEFLGSIVILVPPIAIYDKKTADEIYNAKVIPYFHNYQNWNERKDYYTKNLLWFGCHFYYKNTATYKEMKQLSKRLLKY